MRKVLLVDDEILVRVGLKSVINWEENGYVISGEAADGFDALEKIKSDAPDIVLTDLMMNRMNGFELIRELRREYPQIGIVVLSCYNDFENVKEAMRLGAMDYIFKLTLKPEELLKTLKNVEASLKPLIPVNETYGNNSKIILKNINAIKKNVFKKAFERNYNNISSFKEELLELDIKIQPDIPFLAMIITIDSFFMLESTCKIKEKELLKFSMINIADEVLLGCTNSDVFDYKEDKLVFLFNVKELQGREQVENVIINVFNQLKEYFKRYLGIKVSAGISSLHGNMQTLDKAVIEAEEALACRFFSGNGKCFLYDGNDKEYYICVNELSLPDNLKLRYLEDAVQLKDDSSMESFVKAYMEAVPRICIHSVEKARSMVMELLYPFINSAKMKGFDINDLRNQSGLTPYQVIISADTLEYISDWFMEFIRQFLTAGCCRNEKRARDEIIRAKEYVNANISNDINITTASRQVNMSESYFSHIFKKQTGESFIDYVNRTRIEKAKEMIINTDYRIYEIASMVGMDNANYFSTLFKKITGKSPNDFRS